MIVGDNGQEWTGKVIVGESGQVEGIVGRALGDGGQEQVIVGRGGQGR